MLHAQEFSGRNIVYFSVNYKRRGSIIIRKLLIFRESVCNKYMIVFLITGAEIVFIPTITIYLYILNLLFGILGLLYIYDICLLGMKEISASKRTCNLLQ